METLAKAVMVSQRQQKQPPVVFAQWKKGTGGPVTSSAMPAVSSEGPDLAKSFGSQQKQPAENADEHPESQAPKSQFQRTSDCQMNISHCHGVFGLGSQSAVLKVNI